MSPLKIFIAMALIVGVPLALWEVRRFLTRNKCGICGDSLEDNHFHIDNFHG